MTAGLLCIAAMASAAPTLRAETYTNIRNIGAASRFVIADENTSRRIPDGYWSDCATRGEWDPRPAEPTPRLSAEKEAYIGVSKVIPRTPSGSHRVNVTRNSASDGDSSDSVQWLWDSGANVNVCPQKTHMKNYVASNSIRGVQDASGKEHRVYGHGECWIEVQARGETKIFRIEKVLHVPSFALNIVSESWARSAGLGYYAPPWYMGKSRVQVHDGNGKMCNEFKLTQCNGLNYVVGRATTTCSAAVLNRNESTACTINRQEVKRQHCKVANSKSFSEFTENVHALSDASVLTNMLDGQDDEGFVEDEPMAKLDPARKMQVRLRLADLCVLTTDNVAHSEFFKLHHRMGHVGMIETCILAKEMGLKLPAVEDRWCEACITANMARKGRSKVIHDRSNLLPYEKIHTDIEGPRGFPC